MNDCNTATEIKKVVGSRWLLRIEHPGGGSHWVYVRSLIGWWPVGDQYAKLRALNWRLRGR